MAHNVQTVVGIGAALVPLAKRWKAQIMEPEELEPNMNRPVLEEMYLAHNHYFLVILLFYWK